MGDTGNPVYPYVQSPVLNWEAPEMVSEWEHFEALCMLIFKCLWKNMPEEKKAAHLQLWVGRKGNELIKTWELTEDQAKKCDIYYRKFNDYFEPRFNIRLNHYQSCS